MKKVRQPDRFERVVLELYFGKKFTPKGKWTAHEGYSAGPPANLIRLLRRQHRALVKMIEEATRYDEFEERYPEPRHGIAMMEKGRYINRESVLDDINEYKR